MNLPAPLPSVTLSAGQVWRVSSPSARPKWLITALCFSCWQVLPRPAKLQGLEPQGASTRHCRGEEVRDVTSASSPKVVSSSATEGFKGSSLSLREDWAPALFPRSWSIQSFGGDTTQQTPDQRVDWPQGRVGRGPGMKGPAAVTAKIVWTYRLTALSLCWVLGKPPHHELLTTARLCRLGYT